MLGRQERTAILLLIGVAAIVITAHVSLAAVGKQPLAHPFTNTTPDGELVFLEGTIDQTALTKTGGHVTLRIRNLTVFIPALAAQGRAFQIGRIFPCLGLWQLIAVKKKSL
jgi:hypothetical protein